MKKHMLLAGLLILSPALTRAEPIQDLGKIRQAAEQFLQSQMSPPGDGHQKIELGALDPRLRLDVCHAGLDAQLAPGSSLGGTTTVAVRCRGPKEWTVYVPARIARYTLVVTSRERMARGQRLNAGDIELREADVNSVRGQGFDSLDDVVGSMVKRPLGPAQIITGNDICLICKGEYVTIMAQAGGLTVKMAGLALSDGSYGDIISVRNRDSKRQIQGRITAPGVVEVSL